MTMRLIPPSFKLVRKKYEMVQLDYLKADAVHGKPLRLSFLQKEFDRQVLHMQGTAVKEAQDTFSILQTCKIYVLFVLDLSE